MSRSSTAVKAAAGALVLAAIAASTAPSASAASAVVVSPRAGKTVPAGPVVIRVRAQNGSGALSVSLNGRGIGADFAISRTGIRRLRVSAAHGLRPGINVLRVSAEQRSGTRRSATLRFRVRGDRPLAAAGRDIRVARGGRVTLDGTTSRVLGAPNRRLRSTWRMVSAPKGSRHAVTNKRGQRVLSTHASAAFRPDRIGTYRVRLTVKDARGRTGIDEVRVTVVEPQSLVPIDTNARQGGKWGIQVGSQFYPQPSGLDWTTAVQILTLDRQTLAPQHNQAFDCCDNGHDVDNDLRKLTDASLVIAAVHPLASSPLQPNNPNNDDTSQQNSLGPIGVSASALPDPDRCFSTSGTFAAIGVPNGGQPAVTATTPVRNCGHLRLAVPPAAIRGYLTVDNLDNYTWVGAEHPTYDTRTASTDTSVTVAVGPDTKYTGELPAGVTGGFQVLVLDGTTLKSVSQDIFPTAGPAVPPANVVSNLTAMATKIIAANTAAQRLIVVNSIGKPLLSGWYGADPDTRTYAADALFAVASAIDQVGGVGDTFAQLASPNDGTPPPPLVYSLIGWSGAGGGKGLESSDVIPGGTGRLTGMLARDLDQQFRPDAQYTPEGGNQELLQTIYAPPTNSWPEGNDPGKKAAIAWIGCPTTTPGDPTCGPMQVRTNDLRLAYTTESFVNNDSNKWSDERQDIQDLDFQGGHGFTRADFAWAKTELRQEMDWLDAEHDYFARLAGVAGGSGGFSWASFVEASSGITNVVIPGAGPATKTPKPISPWDIIESGLDLVAAAAALAEGPTPTPGERAGKAAEVVAGLTSLIKSIVEAANSDADDPPGTPPHRAVDPFYAQAGHVAVTLSKRLSSMQDGLILAANLVAGDYAKLKLVGTATSCSGDTCGAWGLNQVDLNNGQNRLADIMSAALYAALLPIKFAAYEVASNDAEKSVTGDVRTVACTFPGIDYRDHPFARAAGTGYVPIVRGWTPNYTRHNALVLGYPAPGQNTNLENSMIVPDPAVTDKLFGPTKPAEGQQAGLGLYFQQFAERYLNVENWTDPRTGVGTATCDFGD